MLKKSNIAIKMERELVRRNIKTEERGSVSIQVVKSYIGENVVIPLLELSNPHSNVYIHVSAKGGEVSISKFGYLNFFSIDEIVVYE